MWRLLSSLRFVYLAAIWYLAWWHAAFIFDSNRCVKIASTNWILCPKKLHQRAQILRYSGFIFDGKLTPFDDNSGPTDHNKESFCSLAYEANFTYLRAPSLLRNAKVPLTTFSTPWSWSMQCFKLSQNCKRLKQLPGQNSSQT